MAMTAHILISRIAALSDANRTIFHLVHRLAKLQFQPGSTPLDSEEGDVRLELSSEIHDSLKQQEEDLELLNQDFEDFNLSFPQSSKRRDSERDRERAQTAAQVARLNEDLRQARSQFRRAQLTAKRAADAAAARERAILLASIRDGPSTTDLNSTDSSKPSRTSTPVNSLFGPRRGPHKPTASHNHVLVTASTDVTAALRRTHDLLSNELSRSQFAQQTLEESDAALAELSESYSNLDQLLRKSGTLISTLLRSQKSDTWYLETACIIFVVTISWLFYRRVLLGPLRLLVLWPIRLAYRFWYWVLSGLFGLLTASGNQADSLQSQITSRSLIIQPSASNKAPRFPSIMSEAPYVPAGAGGSGAKQAPIERQGQQSSLSEEVGQMAEESRKEQPSAGQETRRGDDVKLKERDVPPNPKKRMMEEPPVGERRDEL